ncbi:motile sperm domain-containing protein 1-like [Panonychus citri]|uniref:motile sperm domain-containing protein 1-like n=1 Tax=Panonychus citri TaxID=50023 RepID=UPI0023072E40|nr:motile sperm domain-containing protein 1-like [Panonychus citri]
MVKSTSSTATVITTSGTSANNSDQQQNLSWHRSQLTESSALDLLSKTNVERLKYLDRFPVFVFPHFLCFYANDTSACRIEIKLINPYDWRINYQVLSTVQRRYEVSPAKGTVGANCTSHVTIRLLDTSPRNIGLKDVLRIQVQSEECTGMGSRDLPVHFLAEKDEVEEYRLKQLYGYTDTPEEFIKSTCTQLSKDHVKTITNKQLSTSKSDTQGATISGQNKPKPESKNYPPSFYIVVAVFCGIILCLPNEGESKLPTFLSVSTTPKFVAAYVLGILTSLICKFY